MLRYVYYFLLFFISYSAYTTSSFVKHDITHTTSHGQVSNNTWNRDVERDTWLQVATAGRRRRHNWLETNGLWLCSLCSSDSNKVKSSQWVKVSQTLFLVPRTQTVTFGPRAFSTSGPDAWNTLSSELRHSSLSLDCFKRSLKTFLFSS